MPLRPLPYRVVKRKLEALGFAETTTVGSHARFVKSSPGGIRTAIVPRHHEVAVGTIRSILAQAGVSPAEWEAL